MNYIESKTQVKNLEIWPVLGSISWPSWDPAGIFMIFLDVLDFAMPFGGAVLGDADSDSESQRWTATAHPREHRN